MKWLGIMFMAVLLVITPGYGSAQQPKAPAPAAQPQGSAVKAEPAETAKSFTPEDRTAYEKKTAEELAVMEQRIDDLVTKARKVVPQKRRQVIKIMRGLQVQALDARNQLTALQKAPDNTWSSLKPGLDRTMDDLRKTWEVSQPYLK